MTAVARLRRLLQQLAPAHPWIDRVQAGDMDAWPTSSATLRVVGDAVEITRTIPTGSPEVAPTILDLRIHGEAMVLWTMRGGRFEAVYPPLAYEPVGRSITPGLPIPRSVGGAHRIEFGSVGGRSSDADMPMFLLADLDGSCGLWFAVGHSGRWSGSLTKEPGQPVQRLVLEAPTVPIATGDELDLPRVVMGAFEQDGWAAIRQFLADQCPRRIEPPVIYNTWFNLDGDIDEASCLAAIDVAAATGIEYVVVDAGWYGASGTDFGGPGLGTWTVDPDKFPGGLEPIAAATHSSGLGFGLWFEPERAHRDSTVARLFPAAFRPVEGTAVGLMDFGSAKVRDWTIETLDRAISTLGMDWLKWDFNVQEAARLWQDDARAELAHTRGVHAVLDRLRMLHPQLIIESCASGGNRIDIEMLARCHVANLSDEVQSPEIVRRYLGNASRFLPAQYRYGGLAPHVRWAPDGSLAQVSSAADAYPDAWLCSVAAGTIGIHEAIGSWGPETRALVRRHLGLFKSYRGLLGGSYRTFQDAKAAPLGGWECWEFADEPSGSVALIAFRQHAPTTEHTVDGVRKWIVSIPDADGAVVLTDGLPGWPDRASHQ